jgi:hypothetical protein
MIRRIGIRLLGVVMVCLSLAACRKLPSSSNQPLKIEPIRSMAAISAEYGNLVAVTESSPNLALLWFERPDKSIVIVGVILGSNPSLASEITLIPRN